MAVRKARQQRFGIKTFADLAERQGDLLRLLVMDHTSLRIQTDDSNRSRRPLHPLWRDLQEQIKHMPGLGIVRELDRGALLKERETRIAISVYGYLKRLADIRGLHINTVEIGFEENLTCSTSATPRPEKNARRRNGLSIAPKRSS